MACIDDTVINRPTNTARSWTPTTLHFSIERMKETSGLCPECQTLSRAELDQLAQAKIEDRANLAQQLHKPAIHRERAPAEKKGSHTPTESAPERAPTDGEK